MYNQSKCWTNALLYIFRPFFLVTQNPVLRSWRQDWVTPSSRAACQMSAYTSAWATCVGPHQNSACWTASSTTAVPPSTLCAQTSTRSTAWCSVSPTNTRSWWGKRCVRSSAERIRRTWTGKDLCVPTKMLTAFSEGWAMLRRKG